MLRQVAPAPSRERPRLQVLIKMKRFFCTLPFLLVFACDKLEDINNANDNRIIDSMYYKKDRRTGICYAIYGNMLTYVPCTPEVERMIEERKP